MTLKASIGVERIAAKQHGSSYGVPLPESLWNYVRA